MKRGAMFFLKVSDVSIVTGDTNPVFYLLLFPSNETRQFLWLL